MPSRRTKRVTRYGDVSLPTVGNNGFYGGVFEKVSLSLSVSKK